MPYIVKCIDDNWKYKKIVKKCGIFENISAKCTSNDKVIKIYSNNSFFQTSMSGLLCLTIFTEVIFSIFSRRKTHNDVDEIQDGVSCKMCFGNYSGCHQ